MKYKVILTVNGKILKTMYSSNNRRDCFSAFNEIKHENNVLFERKYINCGKITKANYRIHIVKKSTEDDVPRTLRDSFGKEYVEKPIGEWTVLDAEDYKIEETFWIYGENMRGLQRPNISEVVKRLMIGVADKRNLKEVVVVHNKLLIYNEDQFDMVICKNIFDAQRLHHSLGSICLKNNYKNILFRGTAKKADISDFYQFIKENTGWPILKIKRTTTRP